MHRKIYINNKGMKRKIELKKGLAISKETISKLQESQMASIRGGQGASRVRSCNNASCAQSCNRDSCNKGIADVDELSIDIN